MAQTFNGTISLGLALRLNGGVDIGSAYQSVDSTYQNIFTNGTGANQVNQMWTDTRTIAASTTEDLDLYGSLTNTFGTTLNFTSSKAIIIAALAANTNDLLVGGDAASVPIFGAVGDYIIVKPGGLFMITNPGATGFVVTDTTGDILQIANSSSGTSVTYDIIILGEV